MTGSKMDNTKEYSGIFSNKERTANIETISEVIEDDIYERDTSSKMKKIER